MDSHYLIMRGDLNLVFDPNLDRSSTRQTTTTSKSLSVLKSFLHYYGVSDLLRAIEPSSKYYSFSPVHRSYSRIDYFLLDNTFIPNVTACKYHTIVISDHAPVQLDIHFPNTQRPQRMWRFDSTLSSDEDFCKHITSHIDIFLEVNDTPDVSKSLIWESLKAYLCGQIISFTAQKNKKRGERIKELTKLIADADSQYANNPSADLYKQKRMLQSEFETLSIKETEKLLLRTRQKIYEHGEKAGRLLSHQLRQSISSHSISEIRVNSHHTVTDPEQISKAFKKFDQDLYTSQTKCTPTEINSFLDKVNIPKIDLDQQQTLDRPISAAEVLLAIGSLQSGKAQGPDGFSADFYKAFASKLINLLCEVFLEVHRTNKLPQTLSQAMFP